MKAKLVEDFKYLKGPSKEEVDNIVDQKWFDLADDSMGRVQLGKKTDLAVIDFDNYYECHTKEKGYLVRIVNLISKGADGTQQMKDVWKNTDAEVSLLGFIFEDDQWILSEWNLGGKNVYYYMEDLDIHRKDAEKAEEYLTNENNTYNEVSEDFKHLRGPSDEEMKDIDFSFEPFADVIRKLKMEPSVGRMSYRKNMRESEFINTRACFEFNIDTRELTCWTYDGAVSSGFEYHRNIKNARELKEITEKFLENLENELDRHPNKRSI